MGHQHHWCDEPPDGRLYFNKSFDERYGDEEDMATNTMFTSPEELQRLRCLLAKDPDFENSSSWPKLTEWCSSCTKTRLVKVVLPPEEEVLVEVKIPDLVTAVEEVSHEEVVVKKESCTNKDACTQTPIQKPRRRGGFGSRRRRMLAFQLMLAEKRGLPLSRLLRLRETDARSPIEKVRRLEEKSAPPVLRERRTEVKEEEEKMLEGEIKEEDVRCNNMGASTGGSTLFTPRSFQSDVIPPSSHPFPQVPPFFPPCFPPPHMPCYNPPQCSQMPWLQWVICGACQSWGTLLPCAVLS